MNISENELVTTVTKACIGKGVPRGVAEDLAQACLKLAQNGKPPLETLLAGLEKFDPARKPPVWNRDGENWRADELTVVPFGPSMIDLASLGADDTMAFARNVDFPDLLWGLAKASGRAFQFNNEDGIVSLAILACKDTMNTGGPEHPLRVKEGQWERLTAFARLVMVPGDDMSRADAGAGLTDND